jgi:hypothetical protein
MRREYFWHFLTSAAFISLIIVISLAFRNNTLPLSFLDLLLLALATFRLTHLVVYDTVMDFFRDFFDKYDNGLSRSMSELVHCPWCTGTWMALVVLLLHFLTPLSRFFMLVMAIAGVGTLIDILARKEWKKMKKE